MEDSGEFSPAEWQTIFDETPTDPSDSMVLRKVDEVCLNEQMWRRVMLRLNRDTRRRAKRAEQAMADHAADCSGYRHNVEIRLTSLEGKQSAIIKAGWAFALGLGTVATGVLTALLIKIFAT